MASLAYLHDVLVCLAAVLNVQMHGRFVDPCGPNVTHCLADADRGQAADRPRDIVGNDRL